MLFMFPFSMIVVVAIVVVVYVLTLPFVIDSICLKLTVISVESLWALAGPTAAHSLVRAKVWPAIRARHPRANRRGRVLTMQAGEVRPLGALADTGLINERHGSHIRTAQRGGSGGEMLDGFVPVIRIEERGVVQLFADWADRNFDLFPVDVVAKVLTAIFNKAFRDAVARFIRRLKNVVGKFRLGRIPAFVARDRLEIILDIFGRVVNGAVLVQKHSDPDATRPT
mmetsp:Transcript_29163/g.61909  ORF Transcript_29163/g.61909 Transcript_29163/m.61909 type:complete len:226 (-) Transcript_29163:1143-1820(-)